MSREKDFDILIRLAANSDAATIASILLRSFEEYRQSYTRKAFLETTLGIYKIKARVYNKTIWVAVLDDTICGTISLVPDGNTLHIKSVAVTPSARRRGLGKEMMKHAESIALKRGFHFLELTTTPFLHEAIKLYEGFGFTTHGHKDLYGTPLIRMVKNLKPTTFPLNKSVHVFQ